MVEPILPSSGGLVEPIVQRCAGLDVHKMVVVATVLLERPDGSVWHQTREFKTFREGRRALASWLTGHGVELAVMESTGNYWKSIYRELDAQELKVYVVNARHVKQVPGRKSDVSDSQWLASLGRCGLLRPSFVAPVDFQQLRLISRHRQKVKRMYASEKNRLQKVLDDAGIRLGGVVSDIHGVSAQEMIKGLIAGESPKRLIGYARGRMKSKRRELAEALDEPLSDRHRLLLQELHGHLGFLESQLQRLEQQLFSGMEPYRRDWQLLQTIPGMDALSSAMLLIEIGVEMERFGSAERLSKWAGMCPGVEESAGKRKPVRTPKGNRMVRQLLVEVANAAITPSVKLVAP
jgi:transposase